MGLSDIHIARRIASSAPTLSSAYKRYALATVTAVYTLNFVDRGLINLLLEPIKHDLHLSDTQLGFLTGIAFGLFYAVLGVPIARWADRGNRVTIMAASIGMWGLTVMICLWVTTFMQLVFARVAAAVGEAGCKPPTYSLLGDYFPEAAQRTRAMAIYISGSSLSLLISFVIGGFLNELYGWRMTFFIMGIPGLLLAVLIKLTMVEPRLEKTITSARVRPTPSLGAVLRVLWSQRSCRHMSIGLILIYCLALGMAPWYAAFLIRSHGMSTAELGVWLGLIFSIGGMVGALAGGYASSRWFVGNERGQMRLSAVMVAMLAPLFVAFLTLPGKYQALTALVPLMMVLSFYLGPTYALMQRLVGDEMRATTISVIMLLANLIGMGMGSQIVGILSDALAPRLGAESLRYAMLVMSFLALWAAYHLWRVGETVHRDLSTISAEYRSA